MGRGEGITEIVANDSQVKQAAGRDVHAAQTQETSSILFSRQFTSSLWSKPREATPRKRATLTPDDFLAHAFGVDFAVSVNRKEGSSTTGSSTPSEVPGTPQLDGTSLSSRGSSSSRRDKSKSHRSKQSGGVYPKIPPRGTFSSVNVYRKPKELPSPPASGPPSPVLPLNELSVPDNKDSFREHDEHDDPKFELPMTPEEWTKSTEERTQRRRLRKIALALDVECSMNQLPLDIDCRPVGRLMGLGLPPVNEENLERRRRGRSGRSSIDGFWPTCDTTNHIDEEQFSSALATPESSTIDIEDLTDRYAAMSPSNPSDKQ